MNSHYTLQNTSIEIINPAIKTGNIHYALFDFDGTISLIREGWQQVMIPMMIEFIMETPNHEDPATVKKIVTDFVDRLTGKQTIYQMIQLKEEVEKRGGTPLDPLEYKRIYHNRLMEHIQDRIQQLRENRISPEEMMVPGALEILQRMNNLGTVCYLASGTDEVYVFDEVDLLGLTKYFSKIYGALDNYENYSKKMVIDRIIKENNLSGSELVTFGDGFVEIEDTKSVNGIAVGVASNEATREGINQWKRSRLIEAGADIIIPDFREYDKLLDFLFNRR